MSEPIDWLHEPDDYDDYDDELDVRPEEDDDEWDTPSWVDGYEDD